MKKYVVGFLVASFLLLVLGGAALWFLMIKPAVQMASSAVDDARTGLGQIAAIAQTAEEMRRLNAQVTTTGAFAAPNDGRIDADQVARFVAVQRSVIDVLGPEFTRLDAAARQPDGVQPIADGFAALAQLGKSGIAAKTAQVEALNAQQMSLDEYAWIRSSATAALVAGGVSISLLETGAATRGITDAARRAAQDAVAVSASAGEAIDRARQAAAAASAALRGERTAPPSVEPEPIESAPQPEIDGPQLPVSTTDETIQQANFDLVKPHTETFMRAQLLATLSL